MKYFTLLSSLLLIVFFSMPASASSEYENIKIVNVSKEPISVMFQLQPGCGIAERGYSYICYQTEIRSDDWGVYKPSDGIDVAKWAEIIGEIGVGAAVTSVGGILGSVAFTAADKAIHDSIDAGSGLPHGTMKVTFFHHNKDEQEQITDLLNDYYKGKDKYHDYKKEAKHHRKLGDEYTDKMWKTPIFTEKRANYEKKANEHKKKAAEYQQKADNEHRWLYDLTYEHGYHVKMAKLREHLGKDSKRSECLVPSGKSVIYVDHFKGASKKEYFSCSTVPPRTFFAGQLLNHKAKDNKCFVYHGHKHKHHGYHTETCSKKSKSQQWWYNEQYRTLTNAWHYDRCLGADKDGNLEFGKCGTDFKPKSDYQKWMFSNGGLLYNLGFLHDETEGNYIKTYSKCLSADDGNASLKKCDISGTGITGGQKWLPAGGSVADMAKNSNAVNLTFHQNQYYQEDIHITNDSGDDLQVLVRYRPGCGGIKAEYSYLCESFNLGDSSAHNKHTYKTPEAGYIAAEYVRDMAIAGILAGMDSGAQKSIGGFQDGTVALIKQAFTSEETAKAAGKEAAKSLVKYGLYKGIQAGGRVGISYAANTQTSDALIKNKAILPEKRLSLYIFEQGTNLNHPEKSKSVVCFVNPNQKPYVKIKKTPEAERKQNAEAPPYYCLQE